MAWWEEDRSPLADQLADSSRPVRPVSPYEGDHSGAWAALPWWLLLGAAVTAAGIAVLRFSGTFAVACLGTTVLALGLFYLSQYGTLAFYVLQVGRLRDRRAAAALAHEPPPPLTDHDVRQFHVPFRRSSTGSAFLGLLDPGEGPAPTALRVARVVGGACTGVFVAGAVLTVVAGTLARA
ncbi:hypothetical protein JOE63_003178 [Cellulosimicrobium cellulans]|uniref:Uncharacterized protein n=1 Tax=Cellulosimicrobium cellulans TaxID=1710 RepID=A0A1Y0HQJ3_CELCE|nr:hypothetical protein [Cellulosimicrobium cellulans]ARU50398.1 hypothetical protein CBR64_01655 [Cellulosimicrobium cellulans]MBM7820701.1 hypothetical protein [Cellulosimicrobium cellulans]